MSLFQASREWWPPENSSTVHPTENAGNRTREVPRKQRTIPAKLNLTLRLVAAKLSSIAPCSCDARSKLGTPPTGRESVRRSWRSTGRALQEAGITAIWTAAEVAGTVRTVIGLGKTARAIGTRRGSQAGVIATSATS